MAAAVLFAAGPAPARQDGSLDEPMQKKSWPDWSLKLEPMLWAPALRGDVKLPASSRLDFSDVDADENEFVPAGRATLRADDWTFMFRGFGFERDESGESDVGFSLDGAPVAPGDEVRTEVDIWGFDLTAGYNLFTPVDNIARESRIALDIYGGARVHSVDVSMSANAAESSAGETWAEPIVGGRVTVDLPYGFGMNLSTDVGAMPFGDETSFSWDITVAFTWMFFEDRNAGLEVGFRHLYMNLESDEGADAFEFDGALAGLFGAIVIRF